MLHKNVGSVISISESDSEQMSNNIGLELDTTEPLSKTYD
jgi:hypothetical protein